MTHKNDSFSEILTKWSFGPSWNAWIRNRQKTPSTRPYGPRDTNQKLSFWTVSYHVSAVHGLSIDDQYHICKYLSRYCFYGCHCIPGLPIHDNSAGKGVPQDGIDGTCSHLRQCYLCAKDEHNGECDGATMSHGFKIKHFKFPPVLFIFDDSLEWIISMTHSKPKKLLLAIFGYKQWW